VSLDSDTYEGNTFVLTPKADKIEIAPASDGNKNAAHYHLFVDRDPTEPGDTIPVEPGIIHFAKSPNRVWGLSKGAHKMVLVLGDTTHTHLDTNQVDLEVTIEGPALDASVATPPTAGKGFTITVAVDGVDPTQSHFHALIDPEKEPLPGDTIAAAVEGKIIHTPKTSIEIPALAPGQHTIYIVAGDKTHNVGTDLVGDKLTFTIAA